MRILDLYIGRTFLTYCLLIMLVLAVLLSLFELIAQLDDVGKGSYRLPDALLFVFLTLPKRILDLLPITTLLGEHMAGRADHGNRLWLLINAELWYRMMIHGGTRESLRAVMERVVVRLRREISASAA